MRSHATVFPLLVVSFVSVCVLPSLAHAHGMNAAEMGPPIITSGVLAFVCYWLVVLWPGSENIKVDRFASPRKIESKSTIRIKRKPRLRVIETKLSLADEQPEMRRAADG